MLSRDWKESHVRIFVSWAAGAKTGPVNADSWEVVFGATAQSAGVTTAITSATHRVERVPASRPSAVATIRCINQNLLRQPHHVAVNSGGEHMRAGICRCDTAPRGHVWMA
jgi:hypothetical protein